MQRRVDRRLRRVLAGPLLQPLADRLQREGVVAEQLLGVLQERERCSCGFVVALDRVRLAVPRDTVVPDLDDDHLRLVGGAARDDEGLRHPQRRRPGLELHADTLKPR